MERIPNVFGTVRPRRPELTADTHLRFVFFRIRVDDDRIVRVGHTSAGRVDDKRLYPFLLRPLQSATNQNGKYDKHVIHCHSNGILSLVLDKSLFLENLKGIHLSWMRDDVC